MVGDFGIKHTWSFEAFWALKSSLTAVMWSSSILTSSESEIFHSHTEEWTWILGWREKKATEQKILLKMLSFRYLALIIFLWTSGGKKLVGRIFR